MVTDREQRVEQKRRLTMLLMIKEAKDAKKKDEILNSLIAETEIEMDAEDVTYVQKRLEKIKPSR